MIQSLMSAHGRSAALLATLVVLVLPGGSLIVGGLWLYRYCRSYVPARARATRSVVG